MEKLKNIISPGHEKDDQVMYGSAQPDDPVQTGTATGPGSHFGSSRKADEHPPSSSINPTSTTGTPGISERHSRMPGTFDDENDADTTASIKSGTPGMSQSGHKATGGSGLESKPLPPKPAASGIGAMEKESGSSDTAKSRSSKLANEADPRLTSDLDGPQRLESNIAGGGNGSNATNSGSTGYGNKMTGNPQLGQDTAFGAAAAGHHSNPGDPERSFPLSGSSTDPSGYSAPGQVGKYPAGGASLEMGRGRGTEPSASAGPLLSKKADPGVDSDFNGSRGIGVSNSNHGPDALGGIPAMSSSSGLEGRGPTRATPQSSSLPNKASPLDGSDLSSSRSPGNSAYDPASSNAGPTIGFGAENRRQDHDNHGHKSEEALGSAPRFTSGPHITDTANRLDPNVPSSGIGASNTTTSSASLGHGRSNTPNGKDGAVASGPGGTSIGSYEPEREHTASSGTGHAPTTAGPHKSDMLNKIDPRVDSDLSKHQGTASSGIGSPKTTIDNAPNPSTTGISDPHSTSRSGHHAGIGAGVTAAALGGTPASEYEKDHPTRIPAPTASTTAAPKSSNLANKSDPRVDSNLDGSQGLGSGSTGSGYDTAADTRHHYAGDSGLTGASGVGAYGAHKHIGSHSQATSPDPLAGSGHQYTTASTIDPQNRVSGSGHQPAVGRDNSDPYSSSTGLHTGRDPGVHAAGSATPEYNDKDAKKLGQTHQKEVKHADKETKRHNHHDKPHSGEKKPGILERILHRDHDNKATGAEHGDHPHDSAKGRDHTSNRLGDEETSATAGATGLEDRMAGTGLDDARHGGHPVGSEMQHGSSSGVHDRPIGTGLTTHDAYGTTEGPNKLHKDPPAKVLEQRGV
ncbi:MAG: hypothetical protein Q9163_004633 [Psora crenata]